MPLDRLTKQVEKEGRDLRVLSAIADHGPIGIGALAEETGIPEHKVRYSLRMLEDDGLVEPTPDGAVPTEDLGDHLAAVDEGIDRLIGRIDGLTDCFDDPDADGEADDAP